MKRNARNIHRINQRIHAKKRILERYGIVLNQDSFFELVKQIRNQIAKFVKRESSCRTQWIVYINGQEVPVIYDNNKRTIVTFLPTNEN